MTQPTHLDKFAKSHPDRDTDIAGTASAAEPTPTLRPTAAEIEHFDVLLGAVTRRIRLAVDQSLVQAIDLSAEEALQRLRSTMSECAEALEQLHAAQRHARGWRER